MTNPLKELVEVLERVRFKPSDVKSTHFSLKRAA